MGGDDDYFGKGVYIIFAIFLGLFGMVYWEMFNATNIKPSVEVPAPEYRAKGR